MEPEDKSVGELMGESIEHVREIFRAELRLATVEVKQEAAKAGRGAVLLGSAALFAVFGVNFVLWASVLALAPEMPNWLAALIVAGVALLLALALALAGKSAFDSVKPIPQGAARQMEETVKWAKRQPS